VLLQVFEKVEKSMQKGRSKVIVDAERNRRTLEKPSNRFPWFGGGANSKSTKQVPTTASKVMKNKNKMGAESDAKSIRNRVCDAEAFGERFGRPKVLALNSERARFGILFGTSFAYKSKKCQPKRHPQINVK
jgi:hypothetical protein